MGELGIRWRAKKSARLVMALFGGGRGFGAGWLGTGRVPSVRALTYHRIGTSKRDPFCVRPDDFAMHMKILAAEGRAVSLEQVERFLVGNEVLPEDACLVTIDDGMLSTLTEASPILHEYNVPAVSYVSASLVGLKAQGDYGERYMSWGELRELAASGLVTIGSHANTHRSLGLMPLDEALAEARRSRELLEEGLRQEVRSFAYPFGTWTDFNADTDRAVLQAGYTTAFNSVHGAIRQGMAPVSLPRVKIEGGEAPFMFSRISRGALDGWRVVDKYLWRLQRVRTEIS